jgi:hypothetical protein
MDRQRFRFTINDDVALLKEVLCENPFEDHNRWKNIQEKVNGATSKMFSIRCLKDHLQNLLTSFKKQDSINRKKSGKEEEYNDIKILLQNVIDLSNEFCSKHKYMKKQSKNVNPGVLARDESLIFQQVNENNDLSNVNLDSCFF